MRVFALGGAGQFGKLVAQKLVASDVVSEIVIAGRNLETANKAASELGGKASGAHVDLTDEVRLAALASECDIIVNTAGPEHKAVLPALRAAIKAGVNYCDLGVHTPTTEKALGLDAAAKEAGVTAIIGIGQAGLSNLRMIHAARQFDHVESLSMCIFQVVGMYGANPQAVLDEWKRAGHADASWQYMMKIVAGKVKTFRNGRLIDVDPLEDAVHVRLPNGREVTALPVAIPEPITIPRVLPDIESVSSLYGMYPPQLHEVYCHLGQRIAREEIDESEAAMALFEHMAKMPKESLSAPKGCESGWIDWVDAVGTRNGERQQYKGWPICDWVTTCGPIVTAALRVLRGEIRAKGVLPPEACIEPLPFFAEVAQYGAEKPTDGRYLTEVFTNPEK